MSAIALQNERLRVAVLPELGAKVVSLHDLMSGREWLDVRVPPRRRGLGAEFGAAEATGWDECFPSVAPGRHPTSGAPLPDHGELWSRAWQAEADAEAVTTRIDGAALPYRFERRLSLEGARLAADYSVRNPGDQPFPCLWSMHPLLAAEPGMRIVVPDGALARAEQVLALRPREAGLALKLFSARLRRGRAALHDPRTDEWLGFAFDPERIPYIGLWLNQCGWPAPGSSLYHVAIEPTTGCADDLTLALERGSGSVLPPRGALAWRVTLQVGRGATKLAAFIDA